MLKRLLLTLVLLGLTLPAQASEWALEEWLAEPDVKLVAVEFYADWCGPCKKAAPKWEALRKKYAPQGLKLVVVNLSERSGGGKQCTRLPWNPDESICDPRLGEQLGVTELPEAFVWSWQGNLLVDRGKHVAEIEGIIRRYLDDNPRVSVVATNRKGKTDKALQRMVEAKLNESGKLTVVPDAEMRKRLAKVRKESHSAGRRDDQRCSLGAEVSANSLLTVERFAGSITLSLVDANKGCQLATSNVDWNDKRADKSVHKAVFKLMAQITRRKVQMPRGQVARTKRRSARNSLAVREVPTQTDEWTPEDDEEVLVIKFDSDPPGARVTVDGEELCPATPCRREVPPGRHEVTMSLERYAPRSRAVTFEEGQNVSWSLEPTFGTLTVISEPSGASVTIDGKAVGETPLNKHELPAGEHAVVVEDRCHQPQTRELTLPRGKSHTLEVALSPRPAGLKVKAVDARGDVLTGDVYVDGVKLGKTGKTHKVAVCAKAVEVRHKEHGTWTSELKLREKKTTTLTATLLSGGVGVPASKGFVRIKPGPFTMGSPSSESGRNDDEGPTHRVLLNHVFSLQTTEVTQGQWKALMGTAPSHFSSCGKSCPVEQVSWWDALAYTNALSKREGLPACYEFTDCSGRPGDGRFKCSWVKVTARNGKPTGCTGYRLPTEAEWEYAARAGMAGPRYGKLSHIAWYRNNSGLKTQPVGKKLPNAWGLHDMLGNVSEWAWNSKGAYSMGSLTDPPNVFSGAPRMYRGCTWNSRIRDCRAAKRFSITPHVRSNTLGFRPARTLHRNSPISTKAPAKHVPLPEPASWPTPTSIDGLLSRALKERKKNPKEALRLYKIVISKNPSHGDALQLAARAYLQLGRNADAIRILKTCREKRPRFSPCLYYLGRAYERAGKGAAAKKAYMTLIDEFPESTLSTKARKKLGHP